jgi:hypothetical protein
MISWLSAMLEELDARRLGEGMQPARDPEALHGE